MDQQLQERVTDGGWNKQVLMAVRGWRARGESQMDIISRLCDVPFEYSRMDSVKIYDEATRLMEATKKPTKIIDSKREKKEFSAKVPTTDAGNSMESKLSAIVKRALKDRVEPGDEDLLKTLAKTSGLRGGQVNTINKLRDAITDPEGIDPAWVKHIWNQWM
jgi:hypothetical protein